MFRNLFYVILLIVFIVAYVDLVNSCKAIDEAIEQSVQYQNKNNKAFEKIAKTVLIKIQK